MPTTDEELATERKRVEKLRADLAAAQATRLEREADLSNDVAAARLKAEAAALEVELTTAREAAKAANVRAGVAGVIEPAVEAEKASTGATKAAAAARKE